MLPLWLYQLYNPWLYICRQSGLLIVGAVLFGWMCFFHCSCVRRWLKILLHREWWLIWQSWGVGNDLGSGIRGCSLNRKRDKRAWALRLWAQIKLEVELDCITTHRRLSVVPEVHQRPAYGDGHLYVFHAKLLSSRIPVIFSLRSWWYYLY